MELPKDVSYCQCVLTKKDMDLQERPSIGPRYRGPYLPRLLKGSLYLYEYESRQKPKGASSSLGENTPPFGLARSSTVKNQLRATGSDQEESQGVVVAQPLGQRERETGQKPKGSRTRTKMWALIGTLCPAVMQPYCPW